MLKDLDQVSIESLDQLRENIASRFTLDELQLLCVRLGIDYEELRTGAKSVVVLGLVQYIVRRGRVSDLIRALYVERPAIDWAGLLSGSPPSDPSQPPFPGLRPFTTRESGVYYGRRPEVARLIDRLRLGRFVAVLGVSGSGKSSLFQAGLIHALRERPILADGSRPPEGSDSWCVLSMKPTSDPLGQLALVLTRDLTSARDMIDIRSHLTDAPDALPFYVRKLLDRQERPHLLLIVDQFEELFTQCLEEDHRKAFIVALSNLVDEDSANFASLVIGLRDHFFGRCLEYPELRRLLERSQLLLGPMGRDELTQAIVRPAESQGLHWQPGLVETLLDDLGVSGIRTPEPGALPLMAHALREIWERREGNVLTLAGYAAAGNVKETVGRAADRVYVTLSPKQQEVARHLFLGLIRVIDDGDGQAVVYARQRAILSDLLPNEPQASAEARSVVETMTAERLLTLGQDLAGRETVEAAHEALFSHWPRLVGWLAESRESMRRRQLLREQVDEWENSGNNPDYLYSGEQLNEIERLLPPSTLTVSEQAFLTASQSRRQSEIERLERELATQRQLTQRTRGILGLVSLLALGLIAYLSLPLYYRYRAANEGQLVWVPEAGVAFESYEVTNERYRWCVNSRQCSRPRGFRAIVSEWQENRLKPVVGVDAADALEFCEWIGRTLPTVTEWGSTTPAKEEWPQLTAAQAALCRDVDVTDPVCPGATLESIGKRTQCQYPLGQSAQPCVFDLVGSVSEWTQSRIDSTSDQVIQESDLEALSERPDVVYAGDSYQIHYTYAGFFIESIDDAAFQSDTTRADLGFRCVSKDQKSVSLGG
ncbi:protein of unknown function [Candidatus Promineifilum breve]|uniref:Uncharacterized protein n=1 Tax=Candidatus Promineifilum breve TaxID=1806508 RepID=A0A160SXN5_9CHLR|nr:SUMF1/EgtB/PvdO family nonheme iron enzyme [Candidatus Promineifilum breve]CUS02101.2 protein of unknown function [Candidatus Promineifilum breve]